MAGSGVDCAITRRVAAVGSLLASAGVASAEPFPTMPTLEGRMPCGSCAEPHGTGWATRVAPEGEPGVPIEVSGIIWRQDRRTPASGVTLFVFQTDAGGRYNPRVEGYRGENDPRLRGWMRTGADGRYRFLSIRPGQYSGPTHIHAHLYAPGRPEWFIKEFLFADDPLIPARDRAAYDAMGRFSPMLHLRRGKDGVLAAERDLLLTDDPHRPWPPAA